MNFFKELFIEEYERIESEAEEAGIKLTDSEIGDKAHEASIDRFAAMCDAARDRAKYQDKPLENR